MGITAPNMYINAKDSSGLWGMPYDFCSPQLVTQQTRDENTMYNYFGGDSVECNTKYIILLFFVCLYI